MRGDEQRQAGFIVMTSLEDVVPADHPLRAIRAMVDAALEHMSPELEALYASGGRPSIAPEYLLRAQLVQILYAIPSERRLVEQLRYNLLLRWFVGLPLDQPVFHVTSFTKNRDRLLNPRSPRPSSRRSAGRRRHTSCSPASTSPSTARSSRRPPRSRACGPSTRTRTRSRRRRRPQPDVDWRGERRGNEQPPLHHRPRGQAGAQGQGPRGQALLRRPQPDREP